ncbi:MAG: acyl-CoA thioesterase [Burkholderiales bacterium]|nr:acyl-CoA thioesterase [Burkholderiales bacterium]
MIGGQELDPTELHVELPSGREPVLRVVPMPADANPSGDIFGGWIMSQVDIAGSIPALRLAKGRVATIAVNSFVFKQPVLIGDLVSFFADVARVGRTSITVNVEVYAQRRFEQEITVKVTEATLTYVAVGADRRPRPLAVTEK